MRVAVIGSGGFIGRTLIERIATLGVIGTRRVDELALFDIAPSLRPDAAGCAISEVVGDVCDAAALDRVFERQIDVIFVLAATLSANAEADVRRGVETNVVALFEILERCRAQANVPLVIFASSIATFGGDLPGVVDDDVAQHPTTSYGTHKVIAELLLADYTRHGYIDGRALRLPIVVTRPGDGDPTISGQVSSLIRAGEHPGTTVCRLAPDSRVVVASIGTVVDSLLHLAELSSIALPTSRALNLPGLTVTPEQLLRAAASAVTAGTEIVVRFEHDAVMQRVVDGWPRAFTSQRALELGFVPDPSAESLVSAYRQDAGDVRFPSPRLVRAADGQISFREAS